MNSAVHQHVCHHWWRKNVPVGFDEGLDPAVESFLYHEFRHRGETGIVTAVVDVDLRDSVLGRVDEIGIRGTTNREGATILTCEGESISDFFVTLGHGTVVSSHGVARNVVVSFEDSFLTMVRFHP